ncbi:carbohydrate ABC transporter permease [Anaerocolumna jejuensis]|uniref:carbohydrate ABC transporter permease n=1 Tax=Anaerocolumna jejuensis TaxID=259063 RepID=UPI003F7BC470
MFGRRKEARKKMTAATLKEQRYGRLFIAPPFIGFLIFMAFPIGFAFVASLTTWTGTNNMLDNFVGFQNYIDLFHDAKFWKSLLNTVIYMLGIPIGMVLSLICAVGMNRKIPGIKVLRTMYYVPVVSSMVAVAILWAWVFNYDYGLLNIVIKAISGKHGPNWLGDEGWVKVAMIIFMVWKGLGTSIILYLSGLQSIPGSYYEAAKIDGGSGFQLFRHITIPLVSPVTFYLLIMGLIGGFQVFVEVVVMVSKGGTNYSAATVVYYLYDKAFEGRQMGYGSAIAMLLCLLIFIVTAINFNGQEKWVKTID